MRSGDGVDENALTLELHQSCSLLETAKRNKQRGGDREKAACNMLRTLNPNVLLTRLNVDCVLSKNGGSVNVRRVHKKSALHHKLLTRHAMNAPRFPSHCDNSIAAAKSKRHNTSKTPLTHSKCRCFGKPMVCSMCITRSVFCCIHDKMCCVVVSVI